MSEPEADGRWFRILTGVDQYSRMLVLASRSVAYRRKGVAQALGPVVAQRRAPRATHRTMGANLLVGSCMPRPTVTAFSWIYSAGKPSGGWLH